MCRPSALFDAEMERGEYFQVVILLSGSAECLKCQWRATGSLHGDNIKFKLLPLAGSCAGVTGQADEGVTEESTQAEAHRFLIILGLGHGERPAHCCSSLAMKDAAWPWIRVFSSRLMASIRGLTRGLSLSGSTWRLITAQAMNMWTRRCSCCHSVLVSITVAWACCRLLSSPCHCFDFTFRPAVTSVKMVVT